MDCDAYRDQMLDLLYGEAGEAARRAVEEHHASCAGCLEEYQALRRVRRGLSSWALPAPGRPRHRRRLLWPAMAAAAAAALALGTVVAFAGAELRRDEQGWRLSLGRPAATLQARLDEQEARHRREMDQLRASLPRPAANTEQDLLAVRALVEQSERRQNERLQQALAALSERTDAQRRYDLAQVGAGLSYLEGKAGLHAARTTELMGQVLLASQEK
jgi:hypothetical protein